MKTRVQRWTSLAVCSVLCGGLSLVATAGGAASSAGATTPGLSVIPTNLNFGEVTLGDVIGPQTFTLTNASGSGETFNIQVTGTSANDFFGIPQTGCQVNANGDITVAGGSSCTIDAFFVPGALGERNGTFDIVDTADASVAATVAATGVGGIGYYQVSTAGTVAHFGDAGFFGDLTGTALNHPIAGIAQTGDDGGYWLVATDGGIFNYGDAGFFGSAGGIRLNKPIVGMAPTGDGGGYWLVATDGGIFSYGDAPFYGSTGGILLNKPIVGMAPTPDGGGYWLVASDGGIFSYGDAQFYGSTGSMVLNKPIVGMAPTPDGGGYWLVASDGGIFAYGNAQFFGSTGSIKLAQPIVGMAPMPDGGGYWFTAADGGLFNYGTAPFQGAAASQSIGTVVGMATDGAPTLQAFFDIPAVRAHSAEPVPLFRPLPANARRFAGP
jgi:hypothetical protein